MAASDNGKGADNREKALAAAVAQIEKAHGKGSVMRLGDEEYAARKVEVTPFGIPSLDKALGCGGLPNGRIVELYGQESSGKTSMALQAAAACQRAGGTVAFIDAEHALDPNYAQAIGVSLDDLYFAQPDNGEQALEIADLMARSNAWDLIVVDSVAALVPKAEIEGEIGDSHVGLQARLMGQALRKLSGALSRSKTSMIFINQLREKIGVSWGSPFVTPGGKALKFYASVRMEVKRIGPVKQGRESVIGNRTLVKISKNKVGPPMKETELDLLYGEGISVEGDVIDLALEEKLIKQSGAFFSLAYAVAGYPEGERIGQGREKVRARLKEDDTLREGLLRALESGEVEPAGDTPSTPQAEEGEAAGGDSEMDAGASTAADPDLEEPAPEEDVAGNEDGAEDREVSAGYFSPGVGKEPA